MVAAIRVEGLRKAYPAAGERVRGAAELELFRNVGFEVAAGELVAIVGESGAGKSSLLHVLAALDRPTEGEVWVGARRLSAMKEPEAAAFRNREIGYVWQFHHLMPEFSAEENVAMPLLARGSEARRSSGEGRRRWLGEVGTGKERGAASVRERLSGGEQQRVSLARALVTEPKVLLADEPTGDLDGKTAEAVFGLIETLHRRHGLTSVMVTHSLEFARRCDRVLALRDGRLE